MEKYLVIFAGAGIGGLARFVVATAIMNRFTGRFPLGTFVVNISGCFLIGLIMTILTERLAHQNWRLFLVVGFLGGYTTFSSFAWEMYISSKTDLGLLALTNAIGSVLAGFVAVWLGALIGAKR
ncbi:MAG: fluoride efflux transporter CrcB [Acidobacteriota bacterium]|nr:fluoride efflux transporter CrcB [Acidobacteriota bacterium]